MEREREKKSKLNVFLGCYYCIACYSLETEWEKKERISPKRDWSVIKSDMLKHTLIRCSPKIGQHFLDIFHKPTKYCILADRTIVTSSPRSALTFRSHFDVQLYNIVRKRRRKCEHSCFNYAATVIAIASFLSFVRIAKKQKQKTKIFTRTQWSHPLLAGHYLLRNWFINIKVMDGLFYGRDWD